MIQVPDPLPLRSIPVPREVTAVEGCDCGGMHWHRVDCPIRSQPHEVALAAVDAEQARLDEYTEALTAKLRETLNG